jgi:hypothetical protein
MNKAHNVSVINDIDEFYSLRDEWNCLLALSDQDTIFLRWEWLLAARLGIK